LNKTASGFFPTGYGAITFEMSISLCFCFIDVFQDGIPFYVARILRLLLFKKCNGSMIHFDAGSSS